MKKLKVFLCFLLSVTMLGACQSKPAEDTSSGDQASSGGETLIIRAIGDPQSFNPNISPDDNLFPMAQNMFNRLVKLDASKQIIPDLAESWEISEDAMEITFHLKQNAKWHDGEAVTSEDVKYTFDTIKANPTYYFSGKLGIVDTIETPDEYTVVFKMNTADMAFVSELGWYATFILPKHVFDNGQTWEENPASTSPIGSGPFKFDQYSQGQSTSLVANENYHDAKPNLGKLVFTVIPDGETAVQALINGEIDVYESLPAARVEELKTNPNVVLKLNEYPSPMRMIFNMNNETLKDVAVRKAIATAINRDDISAKVYTGVQKPEYNMYPAFIEWVSNSENTAPKFNIEEVIKTLEDAGYAKDANGFYVTGLTIDVFEGNGYPESAKLIKATLAEAGIDVELVISEYNAWNDKVMNKKDFMIELQGGFMGPDPAMLLNCFGTGGARNNGSYSNPNFDELVKKGGVTVEQNERATYYKEAQKILAEELPYLPIVAFASYDSNNSKFVDLPIDGAGKWGWQEYTFTKAVN